MLTVRVRYFYAPPRSSKLPCKPYNSQLDRNQAPRSP